MGFSSVIGASSVIRPGVCTSTTRPSSPYDGQVIYETDTDRVLVFNGTSWVFSATGAANPVGSVTDIPTSVTANGAGSSATIGANGTVTFALCTSLNINGCFSSTYTNYVLVLNKNSASGTAEIRFRYRAAGTDNSTASSYTNQIGRTNSTTVSAQRDVLDYGHLGVSGGARQFTTAYIYNPFVSGETFMKGLHTNGTSTSLWDESQSTHHNQTASYDGITLYLSTGTFGGTVNIYGLVS
jgi:hypothetical protein